MKKINRIALVLSGIAALVLITGLILRNEGVFKPAAVCAAVLLAIGLGAIQSLKGYRYTAWIIAAVVAGMIYPSAFTHWGSFDLRNKWVMLVIIQMVMFGMGIQMSLRDFTGLAQ